MIKQNNYSKEETAIIKRLYPLNKIDEIIEKTGRNKSSIFQKANRLGVKIDREHRVFFNPKRIKVKNNKLIAESIEEFVNKPNQSIANIAKKLSTKPYLVKSAIESWFPYTGEDKVLLVLESNV